jgi:hypothetical protein
MWWRWTDPIGGPSERKESPIHWMLTRRPGRRYRVVHSVVPKVRDGKAEAIRAIPVARSSAVKARTPSHKPAESDDRHRLT